MELGDEKWDQARGEIWSRGDEKWEQGGNTE